MLRVSCRAAWCSTAPAGLRRVLLSKPEQFVETVAEKLLMYATGRGLEYYDRPAVRAIAREAAADGNRLSALVLGVARSMPFQLRRAAGQPADGRIARQR